MHIPIQQNSRLIPNGPAPTVWQILIVGNPAQKCRNWKTPEDVHETISYIYIIIVQLCMHFCYTLQFYPADPFNRILYIPTNIMRVCRPPT